MADYSLTAAPILGVDTTLGATRLRERDDLALVSIAVPMGGEAALAAAVKDGWGLDMPSPAQSSASGDMRAVRTTADQIMLIFPHPTPDANAVVQDRLNGAGYTTDQTDVWVVLELDGPDVRRAMERLCPHDLSDAAFPIGAAARTVMEHMGAMIVRTDTDRWLLMSASSSAKSFLHAVETSFAYTL